MKIIIEGIVKIFTDPEALFRKIAYREVNMIIPIVVLIITGILLGVIVKIELGKTQRSWKESARSLTNSIKAIENTEKARAYLFPFFLVLFWGAFSLFFAFVISKFGGMGETRGIFNGTSFLVYPYFIIIVVKLIATLLPFLGFLDTIVSLLGGGFIFYLMIRIAQGVGQLDIMHAAFTSGIACVVFTFVWFLYGMIIHLFVVRFFTFGPAVEVTALLGLH